MKLPVEMSRAKTCISSEPRENHPQRLKSSSPGLFATEGPTLKLQTFTSRERLHDDEKGSHVSHML